MSNLELFVKAQNVVMGCTNEAQFAVAKQYVRLAQKVLTHEWSMDLIQVVVSKERALTSR
jgi:hypothetical protein